MWGEIPIAGSTAEFTIDVDGAKFPTRRGSPYGRSLIDHRLSVLRLWRARTNNQP
jgi:hypothetical protein